MCNKLKDIFTSSHGVFLNKKIVLHVSLQKGRDSGKKLGCFDLNVEGCSNIARKLTFLLISAIVTITVLMLFKRKKNN